MSAAQSPTDNSTKTSKPAPDPAPQRIGPYKILSKLGEGGFGVVYLAQQQAPVRRRVALKVIKPGMDSKAVIGRFEAERQALALMNHPNVASVFDAGTTDQGRPYFVMEHVSGVSITEHCDRHKLGIEERLELFTKVCEAVQHAHQKGVMHRDLKPGNILVAIQDGHAVPKVIDFGVVKALSQPLTEQTVFTQQGQLIGTPEYMSPEQAEMTAEDIDTRSDIYSLGVLLYELLTGCLPFDRESLQHAALAEIQRIIREEEPPKPSTKFSTMIIRRGDDSSTVARNRHVDPRTLTRLLRGDLDWITMKALEKDRTRRYATATEFAADIQRHMLHEPVVAGPPSAAYRVRKFVHRNRGAVTAATVVTLILLIATAASISFALSEARQRREAQRQARIAQEVNDFLNDDLLAAADPAKRGRDITVLEVLDAASDKIEGRFQDEPVVEASIREMLGRTYMSLGNLHQAELHLERSLELQRAQFGEDHVSTARSMSNLAVLYKEQARYDEAEPLYVKALELERRLRGEEHRDTLAVMNDLAVLYWEQGRHDEAELLNSEALKISRRTLGNEHPITVGCMLNLAVKAAFRGRHEEAESLNVEALDLSRRVLGEEHPTTLACLHALATLYNDVGRCDEAEPLCLAALEISQRILGEDHLRTLTRMSNLANLYARQGRYDKAEPLLIEALEAHRRVQGVEHPHTLTSLSNLGALYQMQGHYDKAEPLQAEAVELHRRTLPPGSFGIGVALMVHGRCLIALGRYDEAEAPLLEASDTLATALGVDHNYTVAATRSLVALYEAWGKPDQAAEWQAKLREEGTQAPRHQGTRGEDPAQAPPASQPTAPATQEVSDSED